MPTALARIHKKIVKGCQENILMYKAFTALALASYQWLYIVEIKAMSFKSKTQAWALFKFN